MAFVILHQNKDKVCFNIDHIINFKPVDPHNPAAGSYLVVTSDMAAASRPARVQVEEAPDRVLRKIKEVTKSL